MNYALLIAWVVGILTCIYGAEQDTFYIIIAGGLLSFIGYGGLTLRSSFPLRNLLIFGVVIRFAIIPAFPNLSDDIYRYLWDGLTWLDGLEPFTKTPVQYAEALGRPDLIAAMNSAEYHALYPMIPQAIFALLAWVSQGDLHIFTVLLKTVILGADIISLTLLFKILSWYQLSSKNAMLFFLNPLLIIEGVGNAHFDILMTCPLLAAVLFLIRKQSLHAGIAYATSIGSKLLTALYAPVLFFMMINKSVRWSFLGAATAITMVLFIPIFLCLSTSSGFIDSFLLFVNKFEFNGSIYLLIRFIGIEILGYNPIHIVGPVLSATSLMSIITWSWIQKDKVDRLPTTMVEIFLIYLFFSTTVHPWYLILPIALAPMMRSRIVWVWSLLILLSYSRYGIENHGIFIAIEYGLLAAFILWEKRNLS